MPLPEPFENNEEFMGYCRLHSKTPRALFHVKQVNALYEMAGIDLYNIEDPLTPKFISIYSGEMESLFEIIERKRNSVGAPKTVVNLDDYR